MSTAHSLSDDDSLDASQPPSKKQRIDPRTFRNRAGEIQATHDWPLEDRVVALRTPAQAETDVHSSIFLASRSVLCRDSQVLKGILTIPQTQAPQELELYEGHPVVDVQDDPQDLEDFLEALHDYVEFSLSSKHTQAPALAAVLRLSHKYTALKLRRKVLAELQPLIPTTLQKFRDQENSVPPIYNTSLDAGHLLRALEVTGDFPIFLPFLYYRYTLLQGRCDEESLWNTKVQDQPPPEYSGLHGPRWFWSEISRMRVIRLHGNSTKVWLSAIQSVVSDRNRKCDDPAVCHNTLPIFTGDIGNVAPAWLAPIKKSMSILKPSVYDMPIGQLCQACKPEAKARLEKLLEHIWQALPSFIGLDDWEILGAQSVIDSESTS